MTFALMTLLLREHNRCCDEMAPEWKPANDEVCLENAVRTGDMVQNVVVYIPNCVAGVSAVRRCFGGVIHPLTFA